MHDGDHKMSCQLYRAVPWPVLLSKELVVLSVTEDERPFVLSLLLTILYLAV